MDTKELQAIKSAAQTEQAHGYDRRDTLALVAEIERLTEIINFAPTPEELAELDAGPTNCLERGALVGLAEENERLQGEKGALVEACRYTLRWIDKLAKHGYVIEGMANRASALRSAIKKAELAKPAGPQDLAHKE
jgi:hypothetical protein